MDNKKRDGPVPKWIKNRHKIASIDQSGSLGVRPQRCGRERNLGLCILHFSKFVTRESTHLITLSRTFAVARRLDRALAHDALDVPRVGSAVRSRQGLERWMIVANHKRWRPERCSFHPSLAAAMSRFRAATRARSVTRRERFREHRFERAVVPPRLGDVERTTCGNRCLLLVASRRSRIAQIESISRRATDDDDARFRRAQVESRPSTSR